MTANQYSKFTLGTPSSSFSSKPIMPALSTTTPTPSSFSSSLSNSPPSPSHSSSHSSSSPSSFHSHLKRLKRADVYDCRYNQIEEHGVIGNLRTCALIGVSAEICWFCYPNFDSPSIFASILDHDKGGYWSIMAYVEEEDKEKYHKEQNQQPRNDRTQSALPILTSDPPTSSSPSPSPSPSSSPSPRNNRPVGTKRPRDTTKEEREMLRRYVNHKQLYHSETNVLVSRFLSDSGVGQGKVNEAARGWLMRELSVVRGKMCFQIELVPAFNYGRDPHTISIEKYGARFQTERLVMEVRTSSPLDWELTEDGRGVSCYIQLHENEKEVFIFAESVQCPAGHWRSLNEERIFDISDVRKDNLRNSWNEGVPSPSGGESETVTGTDSTKEAEMGKDEIQVNGVKSQIHGSIPGKKAGDDGQRKDDSNAMSEKSNKNNNPSTEMIDDSCQRIKPLGETEWRSTGSLKAQAEAEAIAEAEAEIAAEDNQIISSIPKLDQKRSTSDTTHINGSTKPPPHRLSSRDRKASPEEPAKGECDCFKIQPKEKNEVKGSGRGSDHRNKPPSNLKVKQKEKVNPHKEETKESSMYDDQDDDNLMKDEETDEVVVEDNNNSPAANPDDDENNVDDEHLTIRAANIKISEQLKLNSIAYWRDWISKCTYNGRWREVVYRSALVLKLMTFEPTGAIVAALTTSLPEEVGGQRNWDYRFTWIRDSSFVLYAFLKLGFKAEASAFMAWIAKRCEESGRQDGSLQIMYGLHGEHKIQEKHLDHLAGYKHSQPVRIGNDAYAQLQLDIYGELMDTVYLSNKYAEPISFDFWKHVRKMVDWVCEHWREDDEGVWETRAGKKPFVYSKVMLWVAVDRGIRLAEKRSFPADLTRWMKVRNEIYEEIQDKGWNAERKAFVQSYNSDVLDASVLIMPLVFFTAPTDPRFVSTLEQILKSTNEGGLVSNNLVFRYNVEHSNDGLSGQEGTFSICTFWAVEAAARLGAYRPAFLEKSRFMFEQMLGYANHLGLYSEEIGRRGEHLGNFPQAFTHLALISAAINLDRALNVNKTSAPILSEDAR